MTDLGQIYFQHAVRDIAELQQAATLTQEGQARIQSWLRITALVEVGMCSLVDYISSFVAKYPGTEVEMILTDRVVDLVGEGVGIGLRIGLSGTHAYASPAYLKKTSPLRRPQDLENHSCLTFTNIHDGFWTLEKAGSTLKIPVKGVFSANNLVAIHPVRVEARGVALLPQFFCQEDVEEKRLAPCLKVGQLGSYRCIWFTHNKAFCRKVRVQWWIN